MNNDYDFDNMDKMKVMEAITKAVKNNDTEVIDKIAFLAENHKNQELRYFAKKALSVLDSANQPFDSNNRTDSGSQNFSKKKPKKGLMQKIMGILGF